MGASWRMRSSSPSSAQARSWFYDGMTDRSVPSHDSVAALSPSFPVACLERPGRRPIVHADILLPPADGAGYLGLTRIGHDLLVIVDNYSLRRPCVEQIQDGGLIQFDFRLSGDVALAPSESATVHLNGPGLFISAHPAGSVSKRLTASASRERGITLAVTPQFLTDMFMDPCDPLDTPLRKLTSYPITRSRSQRIPLTAIMYEAVRHHLTTRRSRRQSPRITEGLALELLCAAVSELTDRSTNRVSSASKTLTARSGVQWTDATLLRLPAGTTRH